MLDDAAAAAAAAQLLWRQYSQPHSDGDMLNRLARQYLPARRNITSILYTRPVTLLFDFSNNRVIGQCFGARCSGPPIIY